MQTPASRFRRPPLRPGGGTLSRLRIGLSTLGAISLIAIAGYRIAGWSWLDSVYMVATTLTTVGYREMGEMTPALKGFTILVIVFGVSTTLYTMGGFVQMVLEGEVNRALGLRRVTKEIERLSGHTILCGFGRMGEVVAAELARRRQPFVVVDQDQDRITEATALGYLAIAADSTEEETLLQLGVQKAKSLVITLPGDADNVFITLTARNLNADLKIIARGELRTTEKKLIQAGADRVVLPAATGALRMAAMLTRPSTVELIELATGGTFAEMALDELTLSSQSPLIGSTIGDSHLRSRHGLLVVAIRRAGGELLFNPAAGTSFQRGDAVIAMGKTEDIERFREECGV